MIDTPRDNHKGVLDKKINNGRKMQLAIDTDLDPYEHD